MTRLSQRAETNGFAVVAQIAAWVNNRGSCLVAMGFLGLVLARKKRAATNLVLEPRTQLPQMPQPPGSLEPPRRRDGEITDDFVRPPAD